MSHYLPAFVRVNGTLQQAACGELIAARDHANEPTCQACRDYLALCAVTEGGKTVEELFGEPDPSQIVAPPPDQDVVGDYHRAMRRFQ